MALGLGKLANAIEKAGAELPGGIVETLYEAEKTDVLQHLVEDACRGVGLTVEIPEVPVAVFGRKIFTLGPFQIRLRGPRYKPLTETIQLGPGQWASRQADEGEDEAKPE